GASMTAFVELRQFLRYRGLRTRVLRCTICSYSNLAATGTDGSWVTSPPRAGHNGWRSGFNAPARKSHSQIIPRRSRSPDVFIPPHPRPLCPALHQLRLYGVGVARACPDNGPPQRARDASRYDREGT